MFVSRAKPCAIATLEVAGGSSMVQLKSAIGFDHALEVVVTVSAIRVVDGSKLIAMLQPSSDDTGSDAGAFDAAAYGSHSGGVVGTLSGLLEQAMQLPRPRFLPRTTMIC